MDIFHPIVLSFWSKFVIALRGNSSPVLLTIKRSLIAQSKNIWFAAFCGCYEGWSSGLSPKLLSTEIWKNALLDELKLSKSWQGQPESEFIQVSVKGVEFDFSTYSSFQVYDRVASVYGMGGRSFQGDSWENVTIFWQLPEWKTLCAVAFPKLEEIGLEEKFVDVNWNDRLVMSHVHNNSIVHQVRVYRIPDGFSDQQTCQLRLLSSVHVRSSIEFSPLKTYVHKRELGGRMLVDTITFGVDSESNICLLGINHGFESNNDGTFEPIEENNLNIRYYARRVRAVKHDERFADLLFLINYDYTISIWNTWTGILLKTLDHGFIPANFRRFSIDSVFPDYRFRALIYGDEVNYDQMGIKISLTYNDDGKDSVSVWPVTLGKASDQPEKAVKNTKPEFKQDYDFSIGSIILGPTANYLVCWNEMDFSIVSLKTKKVLTKASLPTRDFQLNFGGNSPILKSRMDGKFYRLVFQKVLK